MHYAVFGFFQLSITCLRSVYAIGIGSMYCWLLLLSCSPFVEIYHDLFIHSPGDGHLFTGFFFSSHEQSFCENSHTGVCVTIWFYFSQTNTQRWDYWVIVYVASKELVKLVSKGAAPVCIPTSNGQEF